MPIASVAIVSGESNRARSRQRRLRVVCPNCNMPVHVSTEKALSRSVCDRCGATLFHGTVADVNSRRLYLHTRGSDLPVIVLFWSSATQAAYSLNDAFRMAAELLEPRARFIRVNVDEMEGLKRRYHIARLPQVMVFKDGIPLAHRFGDLPLTQLIPWIREHAGLAEGPAVTSRRRRDL